MRILTPDHAVLVSEESLLKSDPSAVIDSNVSFVNALRGEHLRQGEISRDAWLSYYADFYLRQVENGGFSQFIYNSKRAEPVMTLVPQGLESIGAHRHHALLKEGESLVDSLGSRIRKFLSYAYFGKNRNRDYLDAITERFYQLNTTENLQQLNAAWLKSNPRLLAVPRAAMHEQVMLRAKALPDGPQREAAARANEPVWLKNIRALCAAAGQQLVRLNAGAGYQHEGRTVFAHHFSTDKGYHFMIDVEGHRYCSTGPRRNRCWPCRLSPKPSESTTEQASSCLRVLSAKLRADGNIRPEKVTQRLSDRFRIAFEYMGIEGLREHDLRHEATCRWLELRDGSGNWMFRLEEVNRIMGWAANSTMAQRYASFRGEDLALRLWAAEPTAPARQAKRARRGLTAGVATAFEWRFERRSSASALAFSARQTSRSARTNRHARPIFRPGRSPVRASSSISSAVQPSISADCSAPITGASSP